MASRMVVVDTHRWEVRVTPDGWLHAWLEDHEYIDEYNNADRPWIGFDAKGERRTNAGFFWKNMPYKVFDVRQMMYCHPDKPLLPDRQKFEAALALTDAKPALSASTSSASSAS